MTSSTNLKIALVGNPNIGKTTLFNKLCGLNQKTGNYPGVTVDKKKGKAEIKGKSVEIIDLPGINSLFPTSLDEELVLKYLLNNKADDFPDKIVVIVSAVNLKRNLYLVDQLRDLNIPMILAINMTDLSEKRGIEINSDELSKQLRIPVVTVSAKKNIGIDRLKELIISETSLQPSDLHFIELKNSDILHQYTKILQSDNEYVSFLKLTQNLYPEDENYNAHRQKFIEDNNINIRQWKTNESILRYKHINGYLDKCLKVNKEKAKDLTSQLDKILLHNVWGYIIFIAVMFTIFQSIFVLASYPMDWIDSGFSSISAYLASVMPEGYFTELVTDGIIPGIGGVVIFVPQIAILFLMFSILEESGYMPRIVYLMDRLMQRFGMSGKSIVPLISGMACAVPAIMSARTISNKKERLITIMVTPLLTCSARIPVYVIIISLIIPNVYVGGIFNAQGLALTGLYLLGIITALLAAWVFKMFVKSDYRSYLILEMPEYLLPGVKNVLISMWTNAKAFIWNAGKIILATSIILFVLATNGGQRFNEAEEYVALNHSGLSAEEQETLTTARKLETSYLGVMGKVIEPAIKPLGYDWKIGIAIISSLAAREVFVGTISTIYSINSEEELTIRDRLKAEVNPVTGASAFGFATSISLLLFYAFSLQCFSTIAVTYKETKSLKWTGIQFTYMLILAYFAALIAYQVLS